MKLRQLRTTWRTSGPFELVRQRQRWFFFLYFFEISFFFLFWNVWSWFVLFVAVAGRKKNSFGATIFLLLLFSRPSPFILFDFFLLFFLAALKNGTLCKGGGFHKTAGNPPHFEEPTPPPPPGPQKIQNERQKKIIFIKSNQTTHRNRWRRGSKNLKGNWKRINR